MNGKCTHCGFSFQREAGFYLGAIYFNYGLTALVVSIVYPVLVFTKTLTSKPALAVCMAFVVLFPLFFFRYARSLWLGFDELIRSALEDVVRRVTRQVRRREPRRSLAGTPSLNSPRSRRSSVRRPPVGPRPPYLIIEVRAQATEDHEGHRHHE